MLKLVTVHGMKLSFIGVGLGLLGSFALTRLMASLLFEVGPTDPLTFSLVPLLLALVSFVACYIPARRATKVDPLIALRDEEIATKRHKKHKTREFFLLCFFVAN